MILVLITLVVLLDVTIDRTLEVVLVETTCKDGEVVEIGRTGTGLERVVSALECSRIPAQC